MSWRDLEPSEKQVSVLKKHGFDIPDTRGEASDIIGGKKAGRKTRINRRALNFIGSGETHYDQFGSMVYCDDGNGNVWDGDDDGGW